MAEIEIDIKTNIFDDPEYCTSHRSIDDQPPDDTIRCPKLGDYDKEGWCYAFDEWVDSERPLRKTNKCKEAWKKAKDSETVSDRLNNIGVYGRF